MPSLAANLAKSPPVQRRAAEIRRDVGDGKTVLLGLDRLDYTKGIEQHLTAYANLLSDGLLAPESSVFVQLVTPSREGISHYRRLRERIDQLVGRINSSFGQLGRPAVHYAHKEFDFAEVAAWYVATDVMVVTPFRDGMNLAAKEYAACRFGNNGVLVLSEFAGTANELDQALFVNPYDLESIKRTLTTGGRHVHFGARGANDGDAPLCRDQRLSIMGHIIHEPAGLTPHI